MRMVIERTGLSADTIRVWERRYGVVSPLRTEGNARRYTEQDVQRLLALKSAVAGGRSIGDLAGLSNDALRSLSPAVRPTAEADALVLAYLEALRRFDVATCESLLARSMMLAPTALVFGVAAPILRAIGQEWGEGALSIAEEHLASFQIRSVFAALLGTRRAAGDAPRVVFAAPPGQHHELGILMAAAIASERGAAAIMLGANTPMADAVLAAERASSSLIVLGLSRSPSEQERAELVQSFREVPEKVTVWLGLRAQDREGWPGRVRVLPRLEEFDQAIAERVRA
jgi:DNA-binding transcriptional MerR regulator